MNIRSLSLFLIFLVFAVENAFAEPVSTTLPGHKLFNIDGTVEEDQVKTETIIHLKDGPSIVVDGPLKLFDSIPSYKRNEIGVGVHHNTSYIGGDIQPHEMSSFLLIGETLVNIHKVGGRAQIVQQVFPQFSLVNGSTDFSTLTYLDSGTGTLHRLVWIEDSNPKLRGTYHVWRSGRGNKSTIYRHKLKHPLIEYFFSISYMQTNPGKTISQEALDEVLKSESMQRAIKTYENSWEEPPKTDTSRKGTKKTDRKAKVDTKNRNDFEVSSISKNEDPKRFEKMTSDVVQLLEHDEIKRTFLPAGENISLREFIESTFDVIKSVPQFSREEYQDQWRNLQLGLTGVLMDGGSTKIIGKPGTGKTYFTNLLVSYIFNGNVDSRVKNRIYIRLDSSTMQADEGVIGPFDVKLKALKTLANIVPVTLVIEEMHTLVGAGTHRDDRNDFYQKIKTELQTGRIKIIGNTTDEEFSRFFAGDQALVDRFPVTITMEEPIKEQVLQTLRNYLRRHADSHPEAKLEVKSEVFEDILSISERFDPIGAQPRKGLNLLKFILAWSQQTGDLNIDSKMVEKAASIRYEFDISQFKPESLRKVMSEFSKKLDSTHVGLSEAKATMELFLSGHMLKQMTDFAESAPASLLLYGPKGSGKTSIAKSVANGLNRPFKEISMSRFRGNDVDQFRTELAMAIKSNPFSVIVLDEVDKASLDVQRAALDVLNSGRFTAKLSQVSVHSSTSEINASNTIIIGTTNAGKELAGTQHTRIDFEASVSDQLDEYFLDRFKVVIPVIPPSEREVMLILQSKWATVEKHLEKMGLTADVNSNQLFQYMLARLGATMGRQGGGIGFLHSSTSSLSTLSVRQINSEMDLIWQHLSRFIVQNPQVKNLKIEVTPNNLSIGSGIFAKGTKKNSIRNMCKSFYGR